MKSQPSIPRHIAIIMDGNGRWAKQRGLKRTRGHQEGAKRVDEIVTACRSLGVEFLTLYTFSTENWLRPPLEVNMLMRLLVSQLREMDSKLKKNGVMLSAQGTLHKLPAMVRKELERVIKYTQVEKPKMRLSLALSYGGRQEILDGVKRVADLVRLGKLDPTQVTEDMFRSHLYHPHFPDPELLIRTGGESRISNFLLWQLAYSEIVVIPELWPDFFEDQLQIAVNVFSQRKRRFGKTQEQVEKESQRLEKKGRAREREMPI